MRFIVMLIFMTTLASWAQKSQTDFMFLLGLERTDEQVATFFKDQFDLSDDEYSNMWKRKGDSESWEFESLSKTEEYKCDLPIGLYAEYGKISSIYVEHSDLSVIGKEKYRAFYSAEFAGGFKFDMIKKELKKKYDVVRLKNFHGAKNPIKAFFRYFYIMGYHAVLPGNHSLRIVCSDKGKSVRRLIYE